MTRGLLVMAYGTPSSRADIERYYTDIRRGHPPSPKQLTELTERYDAIGGSSPLDEITRAQAGGLGRRLDRPVAVGYKHSAPSVADAVDKLLARGVDAVTGLVMAPHYSSMSIADYRARVDKALAEAGGPVELTMIESWHLAPGYVDWLAQAVTHTLARLPCEPGDADVVFTAHSLPERIVAMGDPYAQQLQASADAVALHGGIARYRIAWQSAGRTQDRWLGPDIRDVVVDSARKGARGIVVCPCGFVADHLEVLYDIDIEAHEAARSAGIPLLRTPSPNHDDGFLDALADVVRGAEAAQTRGE